MIGSDLWSTEDGFDDVIAVTGVTGICGSGIIEMVAEMRMHGIVDAPGLIGSAEQTGTERCFLDGRTNSYLVYDGTAKGGPKITVTNRDIREIQMAKAALYSGARLLMDKFGVDKVDRVVLAGAIHKIETAIEPRFQEHFVNASAIPNAVEPFPILNALVTLPTATFNTGGGGASDGSGGGRRRRKRA